jgi:hypothetical protein
MGGEASLQNALELARATLRFILFINREREKIGSAFGQSMLIAVQKRPKVR